MTMGSAGARVLVTGAAGFVGSHFAPYLAGRGFEVRAIDVHPPAQPQGSGVDFRVQDIRELQGLAQALEGVDTVFNLASVHLDRKSTRLNSSHPSISYAVFCLKKKKPHFP